LGGTVTHNGECENTWLGQDLENHLQIGSNQNANEVGDHVIIQSHQFGILRSNAMLLNNDSRLPEGETGGCVIDCQPEAKRNFDGHRIHCTTFIELEKPHCVRL